MGIFVYLYTIKLKPQIVMHKDLKKAIVNFMFDNSTEFQLLNVTKEKFRQYIFTPEGDFCFGGSEVIEFIRMTDKLIKF